MDYVNLPFKSVHIILADVEYNHGDAMMTYFVRPDLTVKHYDDLTYSDFYSLETADSILLNPNLFTQLNYLKWAADEKVYVRRRYLRFSDSIDGSYSEEGHKQLLLRQSGLDKLTDDEYHALNIMFRKR